VRKASAVIVSTQDAKQKTLDLIANLPERIHVVPAAYSKEFGLRPQEELEAVRDRYDLPERFILFVGGLHPIKNVGRILRALHLLRESWGDELPPLVAVGFKRWKVDGELALIDELGLQDKVIFPGYIPDADLPAFYNLATLFLFPSLYEGFGIPVLEAMACGCPVVTSKTGASPEVSGGAALLADPYDPREIAEQVNEVLKSEGLRASLSEKGLERVEDFDWRNTAAATLSLMLHAVRGQGGDR
jgi:glycosyltransferase involved in cell wall biosynthesis